MDRVAVAVATSPVTARLLERYEARAEEPVAAPAESQVRDLGQGSLALAGGVAAVVGGGMVLAGVTWAAGMALVGGMAVALAIFLGVVASRGGQVVEPVRVNEPLSLAERYEARAIYHAHFGLPPPEPADRKASPLPVPPRDVFQLTVKG